MSEEQLLLKALKGEITKRVPFWFMRQAGRYLPEYRKLRATTNGFLDLCFTPDKAAEVTLQPIRRFGMDGAILFSDILVIPHALGAEVRFAEGEGPIVEQTITPERIAQLRVGDVAEKLAPVFETIRILRRELPAATTLIGFAGSPWTVACYMLQGPRGGAAVKDFATARRFAYAQPVLMQTLIDTLVEATIAYLKLQVEAGAQALQLFDSWAGLLTPEQFDQWSIAPTKKIAAALRAAYPEIPLIGFPKGAGHNLPRYARETGVQALGIDMQMALDDALAARSGTQALQGNLDPLLLAADGAGALASAQKILARFETVPAIFNLGHGIQPDTPIANVEALCDMLKAHRRNG